MTLVTDDMARRLQSGSTGVVARKRRAKRVLDIAVCLPALLFLLPGLLAIALALFLVDGGPIIFRHRRIGLNGKAFDCLKFRTMRKDAAERLAELLANDPERAAEWKQSQKLKGDPRVHWVGKYLRITSLDELPQLINVLRGDMSLVGPRPIIAEEMERYGPCLPYYLSMKPGMTGLWQVTRDERTTYEARVGCDVEYYERCSLRMDLAIIWKTVGVVLIAKNDS